MLGASLNYTMKHIRKLISNYLGIILIFGCGIVLVCAFVPNYTTLLRLQKQQVFHKQKLVLAEKRNQFLQKELDRLQNSPEGIEQVAREKLGWAGTEETVYRFRSQGEKSD